MRNSLGVTFLIINDRQENNNIVTTTMRQYKVLDLRKTCHLIQDLPEENIFAEIIIFIAKKHQ